MKTRKALVLGASGLTGRLLLKLLLQDDVYDQVTVYARKNLRIIKNKLVEKIIDYENLETAVEVDDVFCCLGTTIKKAGSKQAFKVVDLDFPVKVAKLQKAAGTTNFLVISALGADTQSSVFYNKTKGKMEEALKEIGFSGLFIFRPFVISGGRKEHRAGEKLAINILKIINPLLVGPLRRYRSVKARAIAAAMVYYALSKQKGTQIITSQAIKEFE